MSRPSTNEALERLDVQEIIKALKSGRESDLRNAEAALLAGGAPMIESLLGVLSELEEERNRRIKAIRIISIIFQGVMVGALFFTKSYTATKALVVTLYVSQFAGSFANERWTSRLHRNLILLLSQCNDMRLIGPLLDATSLLSGKPNEIVEAALTRMLPKLRTSDKRLITNQQLATLNSLLQNACLRWSELNRKRANHMMAMLHAIGEIGDQKAIQTVKTIVDYKSQRPIQTHVQVVARECLEALSERVERESVGSRLLRAAESPSGNGNALLRPAQNSATQSEQLLRVPEPKQ